MTKYLTRRGDGVRIEMTSDEIKRDIEEGSLDAADRGKIAPLSQDDLERLLDIFTIPGRIVGVEPGNEIISSDDAGPLRLTIDSGTAGVGVHIGRMQQSKSMKDASAPTLWSWVMWIIASRR
jgi:dimethylamine--corrinoid protein Co-methyltransferase